MRHPSRFIFLLGPRGSGKSSVGRRLAGRLELPFVDLDARLVEQAGRSIAEIFRDEGEAGFRDREAAVLQQVLAGPPAVVATGGGVIIREENRRLLKNTPSLRILLIADPETLFARITADPASAAARPALTDRQGADEVRHLLESRRPWYDEVATHVVDVTDQSIEQVCARVSALATMDH